MHISFASQKGLLHTRHGPCFPFFAVFAKFRIRFRQRLTNDLGRPKSCQLAQHISGNAARAPKQGVVETRTSQSRKRKQGKRRNKATKERPRRSPLAGEGHTFNSLEIEGRKVALVSTFFRRNGEAVGPTKARFRDNPCLERTKRTIGCALLTGQSDAAALAFKNKGEFSREALHGMHEALVPCLFKTEVNLASVRSE